MVSGRFRARQEAAGGCRNSSQNTLYHVVCPSHMANWQIGKSDLTIVYGEDSNTKDRIRTMTGNLHIVRHMDLTEENEGSNKNSMR